MCAPLGDPLLMAVNWGTEEIRIVLDSRRDELCEVVETISRNGKYSLWGSTSFDVDLFSQQLRK